MRLNVSIYVHVHFLRDSQVSSSDSLRSRVYLCPVVIDNLDIGIVVRQSDMINIARKARMNTLVIPPDIPEAQFIELGRHDRLLRLAMIPHSRLWRTAGGYR